MKLILIGFLIGLLVIAHQQPTQTDLDNALRAAIAAWGVTSPDPVSIRFVSLNPCKLGIASVRIANTVRTWTSMDDGPRAYAQAIEINSNCDWGALPLLNVVVHEYGHVLMGPEHSTDKHSVMFWIVGGAKQSITAADRKRLEAQIAGKEGL